LRRLEKLDPLAGLVLESGDDLAGRRVLLGVVAFLPSDDKVGGLRPEGGRHGERGRENQGFNAHRALS
jgi:hypothetical protein